MAHVASFVSIVPVAVGISRRAWRNPPVRILWLWLLVIAAVNIITTAMGAYAIRTSALMLYSDIVLAWLGLLALSQSTTNQRIRTVFRALGVAYSCWWVFCVIVLDNQHSFSSYSYPAVSVVLTIAACILLVVLVRDGASLREWRVLVGLGTLISFASFVPLGPVSEQLYPTQPRTVLLLWELNAVLLILGSILFTLALKWAPNPPP